jgi:hypothetical protein
MAEQGSKVKRCGKHVDQDLDVESSTALSPRYAPIESRADRSPPSHVIRANTGLRRGLEQRIPV